MIRLTDLLERLEAADGPDRELDAHLAVMQHGRTMSSDGEDMNWAKVPNIYDDCTPGTYWRCRRSGNSLWTSPPYTSSIDAAVQLAEEVLPGYIRRMSVGKRTYCVIGRPTEKGNFSQKFGKYPAYGPTEPLALCIAIVKARIAQEKETG
jgi:hypothetical protein